MNNFNLNPLELLKRELQLRNYSPRTIKTYLELLALLEKSTGILLKDINTEEFKKFLLKRIKEDCVSTSTVNQTISAFKLLQTDVFSRNWEEIRIKRPRKEKKLPTILSTAEVERIIAVTRNIKHRAILALSYSAGLRKMELLNLKISAIDPERMRIHVRQGKGKKDRDTLLSVKVLELLRFYYKIYKPSQYLFEPQGKKGIPMSEKTMDSIIRKNAERAGIKKNVSFHTLRHCFATHLLEQGVNLRLIQSFLGHTSIKTTSIYLHVANIDPASITSPYDKFNI